MVHRPRPSQAAPPSLPGTPTGGPHLSDPSPSSSRRRRAHASAFSGPRSPPHRAVAAVGFARLSSTPAAPSPSSFVAGIRIPSRSGHPESRPPVAVVLPWLAVARRRPLVVALAPPPFGAAFAPPPPPSVAVAGNARARAVAVAVAAWPALSRAGSPPPVRSTPRAI
uniref:Uncharacterized protein n=1 Tax=Oryza sativa subsp. japonica TaxID=39947 RepID=Q5VMR1_ORYSJ|nr:hypothetical protein [Oryza sativa Japonica Group]BAD69264.1 hypothetical protein [Oryza sativa Japonica Group]